MKNNTIALRVFRDGDHLFDKTFEGGKHDVIKIGKLRSSHLCLDGDLVARMHAVLEFNREEGAWRLIDLGSYSGSVLDGAKIERNAKLPEKGTLNFGNFEVRFECGAIDLTMPEPAPEPEPFRNAAMHHYDMLTGLVKALEDVDEGAYKSALSIQKRWAFLSDEKKRHFLRLLVAGVRQGREMKNEIQTQHVASVLNLGVEGLEKIYQMEPYKALEEARVTLAEMVTAKASLEFIAEMELPKHVEKVSEQDEGHGQALLNGHKLLVDKLTGVLVQGSSLLVALLSRAGGGELSEKEREEMRAAFSKAEELMKNKGLHVVSNEAN